jgi:hypothetical protein
MYDAQTSKAIKHAFISCPTIKQFEATSILLFYLLCNFVMLSKWHPIHKKIEQNLAMNEI